MALTEQLLCQSEEQMGDISQKIAKILPAKVIISIHMADADVYAKHTFGRGSRGAEAGRRCRSALAAASAAFARSQSYMAAGFEGA